MHVVQHGETVWRISQKYGSTVDAIVRANGIDDVTKIHPGQRLLVPAAGSAVKSRSSSDPEMWTRRDRRGTSSPAARFEWPVRGRVSSGYGMRGGAHHDGIDIRAASGTAVRAAEAGRVVHADDSLPGYGKLVILKHAGPYSTVYAHNRKILVRVGEFVKKGQVIAEVGQTGRASAPHLHFEVRRDGAAKDPLDYLP